MRMTIPGNQGEHTTPQHTIQASILDGVYKYGRHATAMARPMWDATKQQLHLSRQTPVPGVIRACPPSSILFSHGPVAMCYTTVLLASKPLKCSGSWRPQTQTQMGGGSYQEKQASA